MRANLNQSRKRNSRNARNNQGAKELKEGFGRVKIVSGHIATSRIGVRYAKFHLREAGGRWKNLVFRDTPTEVAMLRQFAGAAGLSSEEWEAFDFDNTASLKPFFSPMRIISITLVAGHDKVEEMTFRPDPKVPDSAKRSVPFASSKPQHTWTIAKAAARRNKNHKPYINFTLHTPGMPNQNVSFKDFGEDRVRFYKFAMAAGITEEEWQVVDFANNASLEPFRSTPRHIEIRTYGGIVSYGKPRAA